MRREGMLRVVGWAVVAIGRIRCSLGLVWMWEERVVRLVYGLEFAC